MNTSKWIASVNIDFGMTASTAEYYIHSLTNSFLPPRSHRINKTPTALLYGDSGNVIAWGKACGNNTEAEREFKAKFEKGGSPEVQKWIKDYLDCFGRYVLEILFDREKTTPEELSVTWYLTMPGGWEERTQTDFRVLAHKVFTNIHPGSIVVKDINESQASCEFLASHFQFNLNTWAITCDIGGSTCDTAFAIMKSHQESSALIPQVFYVSGTGTGHASVKIIDRAFEETILPKLRAADVVDCKDFAASLIMSSDWKRGRHEFNGSNTVHLVTDRDLGIWEDPSGDISIHNQRITLSSGFMVLLFQEFLDQLSAEIDATLVDLKKVTSSDAEPTLIALSGGGGGMPYLLKYLKVRYPDIPIKAPSSIDTSCHATVMGQGILRLREMTDEFLKSVRIGCSGPCTATEVQEATWVDSPTWDQKFRFSSSKRNLHHFVIVHQKFIQAPKPPSIAMLQKYPGQRIGNLIWKVDVILPKHKTRKQDYCLEVSCRGRSVFSFRAYKDGLPEESFELATWKYGA